MSSERILAAEVEQLKGYIAMSEVNCNAAYNDLQKDRDVTKAKLFISDEKLREAEVEVERLRKEKERLMIVLNTISDIVSDSDGVAGYHLNGDIASWDSFGFMDAIQDALK